VYFYILVDEKNYFQLILLQVLMGLCYTLKL
jgi:hypothetical protein